ncbi:MAG TPA: hypothetical protein DHV36_00180 [Desulfobacteraceae bacterium]|nr:hypothetical protein [Desulfobacteraceae bacterium]|tara:strand:+ start:81 stop:491 length:411 start_codon:yes stop_codon:yes gene_type:complete
MIAEALLWSIPVGIIHFAVMGALYGNPFVDKIYMAAQQNGTGVRRWPSKPRYLITQFFGTQVEVIILVAAYLWLRPDTSGMTAALGLGLVFTAIRVYPRFWNMWIQTDYPRNMLAIEAVNGTIGTFLIVVCTELFC